jgi:hypothetical protein
MGAIARFYKGRPVTSVLSRRHRGWRPRSRTTVAGDKKNPIPVTFEMDASSPATRAREDEQGG